MADRRLAARMQLVEVEDAPTAADRSRPPDNPPPQDRATVPSSRPHRPRVLRRWWPVAARRRARRGRVRRRGVGAGPRVRRAHRRGARPGPTPRRGTGAAVGDPRGRRCPAPCSRPTARSSCSRRARRAWTVTSHDAVSGAAAVGGRRGAGVARRVRGDGGGLPAAARRRRRPRRVPRPAPAGAVLRRRVDPGAAAGLGRPAVGAGRRAARRLGASAGRSSRSTGSRTTSSIGTLDADGRMMVQRRDARTGRRGLVDRHPGRDERPGDQRRGDDARAAPLVVLEGGATIVLDVEDGSTLMTGRGSAGSRWPRSASGSPRGRPSAEGTSTTSTGPSCTPCRGCPRSCRPTTARSPGRSSSTRARRWPGWTRRPGREQWRTPSQLDPRLLVSDRLVVVRRGQYGVLDVTDGSMLWDVDTGDVLTWNPVSDGTLVLGPGHVARRPAGAVGPGARGRCPVLVGPAARRGCAASTPSAATSSSAPRTT